MKKINFIIVLLFICCTNVFAIDAQSAKEVVENYYGSLQVYAEDPSARPEMVTRHFVLSNSVYNDLYCNLFGTFSMENKGSANDYVVQIGAFHNNYGGSLKFSYNITGNEYVNSSTRKVYVTKRIWSNGSSKSINYTAHEAIIVTSTSNGDKISSISKQTQPYTSSGTSISTSTTNSPSAQINNITVLHNQNLDEGKGMIIKVSFDIQNMNGKNGYVVAYFYDNNGNALLDTNGKYHTSGNPSNVSTGTKITPNYDNSRYTDLELKIPYSELHQTGNYTRTLKFFINIWDQSVTPNKVIYRASSYTTFTYTPTAEIYLTVNGSTSNKTKSFSEYGGRETYTINTNASSFETWGVPSWCRIENKTSTSFTLVCEPKSTVGERSDYMKIIAGGKEIRIDIKQTGKKGEAIIKDSWIIHNLKDNMWNGYTYTPLNYMNIHCHFSVSGHQGEDIRVCAFFYHANGEKVYTTASDFKTPDGQATVQVVGHCTYENTLWKDFQLNIPYYVFPKGELNVKIQIQDKNGNFLVESSPIAFTVS